MRSTARLAIVTVAVLAVAATTRAAKLPFNILESTPVGSWQVRETTTTDHKGRQAVTVMRTGVVGEEERDGQPHVWIETVVDRYELKKGERKHDGDTFIMKALIENRVLTDDPANIISNLSGFGKEVIMQRGDDDPMKLSGGGALAESMMKAMGAQVTFVFETIGEEKVTVPAGTFDCTKVKGKGHTEMKILFKKIESDSESEMWLNGDIPFGMVKANHETTTNGKTETGETVLVEYGTSGATSRITKEPKEMPKLPGGLFGR